MQVQMLTTAAGPAGVFLAGNRYEIPDALARAWIDAGFALDKEPPKPVPPKPKPPRRGPKVERATLSPPETADVPPRGD